MILGPSDAPAWLTFQPAKRDTSSLQLLAQTVMAGNDANTKRASLKQKAVDDAIKGMGFDKWHEKLDVMSGDKLHLLRDLQEIENAATQVAGVYNGDAVAMSQSPYFNLIQQKYGEWMTNANTATEAKKQYETTATAAKEYKNELVFRQGSFEPETDSEGNYITADQYLKDQWFTANRKKTDDGKPGAFYIPDFGLTLAKGADTDKALNDIFSKAKTADGTFNWEAIGSLGPEVSEALQTVLTVDPSVKSNAQQLSTALGTIYSKMDASVFTGISNEYHKLFGSKQNVETAKIDFLEYATNYIRNVAKVHLTVDKGKEGDGSGSDGSGGKSGYFMDALTAQPNVTEGERTLYMPFKNKKGENVYRGVTALQQSVPKEFATQLYTPGASMRTLGVNYVRLQGNDIDTREFPNSYIVSHTGKAQVLPMTWDNHQGEYRPVRTETEHDEAVGKNPTGNPSGHPPMVMVQDIYSVLMHEDDFESIEIQTPVDQAGEAGKAVKPADYLKGGKREVPSKKVNLEKSWSDIHNLAVPTSRKLSLDEAQALLSNAVQTTGKGDAATLSNRVGSTGAEWRLVEIEVTRPLAATMLDPIGSSAKYADYTKWMQSSAYKELQDWLNVNLKTSKEADITNGGQ